MMRTLDNQKSVFQEMLSQSNQGTITSGGSAMGSTSQPHLYCKLPDLPLPEFHGDLLKFK
ncbi:MAG: hypothetical protein GY696_22425 [Gammaproteobacteria bacterium]|nr:hypothetical protein [Gammaproteobacteria bacterium]